MENIYQYLKYVHVAFGTTALLTGAIAILLNKRSKGHKLSGKIYVAAMVGVSVTSTALYFFTNNIFLLLVGIFSLQLVLTGWRALFVGKRYKGRMKPQLIDYALSIIPGVLSLAMLGLGLYAVIKGNNFGTVPIVFGIIGMMVAYSHLKQFFTPSPGSNKLTDHLRAMGGSYIAALTAFLVTNHPAWMPTIMTWLLPTVIGSVLIAVNVRKYKSK
jgi:uncharacterized membrane protein